MEKMDLAKLEHQQVMKKLDERLKALASNSTPPEGLNTFRVG
jgi:hypothetical protein